MRTLADLDALIDQAELGSACDLIRSHALPAFNVLSAGKAEERLGATRFGGLPDLPVGSDWPLTDNGESLQFLAQLDLDDIARRHGPSELPPAGLLSVFAGGLDDPADFSVAVRCSSADAPLVRLQPPERALRQYTWRKPLTPIAITLERTVTIPGDTFFDEELETLAPGSDPHDLLEQSPARHVGQLLGHSTRKADDLHAFMAMAELGFPGKDSLLIWKSWEAWEDAKRMRHRLRNGMIHRPWSADDDEVMRWILANRDRIIAEIRQWRVLLDVESNKDMGLDVGDAGSLAIMIRADDLAARNFTRARAITT